MLFVISNKIIELDKEGYLACLADWSEEVAYSLAQNDNLILTADHWKVVYFLRNFYQQYQTTPPIRVLVKELAKEIGPEKGNSIYLSSLFPKGLAKQASKLAGLPKPTKCI